MLKYTLVLAAASVTIANGEKLTLDDAKEIKETCKGAIDDLLSAKDSAVDVYRGTQCQDLQGWPCWDTRRCNWEAQFQNACKLSCGVCQQAGLIDGLQAIDDANTAMESSKECYNLLKEKCGSLSDYKSILGVNVELISEYVDLSELQDRAGCGVEEDAVSVSTGTGSGSTRSTGEEEEASSELPIPVIAGVVGVAVLGGISYAVYYFCVSKSEDVKETAAEIAADRV